MHEQENAKVKGKGGAIGLMENHVVLQRWMICGPEIAKCLSEFKTEGHSNNNSCERFSSKRKQYHHDSNC